MYPAAAVDFFQADVTEGLAFESGIFDRVTLFDALVHFENKREVLTEIARVLQRGGQLALTTVLGTNIPKAQTRILEATTGSIFRLELATLLGLLQSTGFRVTARKARSEQLARWHTRRYRGLLSVTEELERELGEEEFRSLLAREQAVLLPLQSGALTSIFVIAEKQS